MLKGYLHLSLVAGLAIAIAIVIWLGIDDIVAVLAVGGWQILWLAPYHVPALLLAALSWRWLFPPRSEPRFEHLAWFGWMGASVNSLLPAAQVGGEFVRMRLLSGRGVAARLAGASVVVDKTIQAVDQIIFTLFGLILFVAVTGDQNLTGAILVTAILLTAGIFGFYKLQRAGLFERSVRLAERFAAALIPGTLAAGAASLDREIHAIYDRRLRFLASLLWRLLERIFRAGEVWLALYFLGHPISIAEAIIFESLAQAIRAAVFVVPGGLGFQEGGIILIGAALGFSPELSFALALAKRLRELLIGLPGLVAWQLIEGRSLIGRRKPPRKPDDND